MVNCRMIEKKWSINMDMVVLFSMLATLQQIVAKIVIKLRSLELLGLRRRATFSLRPVGGTS